MNMRDGFKGGMEIDESIQVAKRLLELGAHGLVLSGGFVSQSADVCNERCHADSFDVLLYELLVAEIRSPYVWQMDDPLCTLQRGLFP